MRLQDSQGGAGCSRVFLFAHCLSVKPFHWLRLLFGAMRYVLGMANAADEMIMTITWNLQDIADAIAGRDGCALTVDDVLSQLSLNNLESRSIEAGWTVIEDAVRVAEQEHTVAAS
jgi:hypothetical protein